MDRKTEQALDKIDLRYDAEYDLATDGPDVTWAVKALADVVRRQQKEIDGLKRSIAVIYATLESHGINPPITWITGGPFDYSVRSHM